MTEQTNPINDLLTALTAQAKAPIISRLTNILGMDGWSDSTTLPENTVQLLKNFRILKNVIYVREGWTKYNSIEMS